MDENKIDKILDFLKEIEKYKTVERKMWTSNLERKESDAEHSWHMAMFLILFKEELPEGLDFEKMLKLALIHDLPEIYSGDPSAFDEKAREGKQEREMEAAKKLFAQMTLDLEKEFMELFKEYESCGSKEAQIVNAIDKMQAVFQNLCSGGKSWQHHEVSYEMIENYKKIHMTEDKFIQELYENIMKKAKDSGWTKQD